MYVDAMVAPVRTDGKDIYAEKCRAMSELFMKNGALSYMECWGEDVPTGEVTSFTRAVELTVDETCAVSFITYQDRAARDACMEAVMADPEAQKLFEDMPLDGKRMIFGGFTSIVSA